MAYVTERRGDNGTDGTTPHPGANAVSACLSFAYMPPAYHAAPGA